VFAKGDSHGTMVGSPSMASSFNLAPSSKLLHNATISCKGARCARLEHPKPAF